MNRYFRTKTHLLSKETLPALLLGVALSCCITFYLLLGIYLFFHSLTQTPSYETLQEGIADEVLRLHIIADSNSDEDQAIKLKVKEAVVTYLRPYLSEADSKEEAIKLIQAKLSELVQISDEVLASAGYSYRSSASLERCDFPIKAYGDITLPAGEYDALRICLGSASGKNWWCLVFPKLCFADITHGTLPEESKAELKELLTEDEYAAIFTDTKPLDTKKPKFRLRILKLIDSWF